MTKLVVIVGPTASGKSSLAVELARKLHGEVISADSRQVYKGLNIGTGKITKREMKDVPHHLLDVASPRRTFTAYDFALRAQRAIADVAKRGKVPIICGGSGFYIDALVGRIALSEVPADKTVRAKLEKKSTEALFTELVRLDPTRAQTIDKHNKVRLIRALEIAQNPLSKKPRTVLGGYDICWIGLSSAQDELRTKINKRLRERLRHGMIAEARGLHTSGLSYKRMDALGLEYRSLARYLKRIISKQELESELQSAIWQYARRQRTYWRRNKNILWFHPRDVGKIMGVVTQWS